MRAWAKETNRLNRERCASGEAERKELAYIEKKMAAMISVIEDGGYVKGMIDRLRDLEARQEELKERLATVPPEIPDIHPNITGVYRRKVARFAETLHKPGERDAAADAIRGLIERIVFIPVPTVAPFRSPYAATSVRSWNGGESGRKSKDLHTRLGNVGLGGCGGRL